MDNKRNKTIAREFLVFIAFIIIEVFLFSFIYLYNFYQKSQIEITNENLTIKNTFINNALIPINKKKKNQEWFFKKISSEFDISNSQYSKLETLWPIMQKIAENDSTKYRWDYKWEKDLTEFHKTIGFTNPKVLQDFILKNSLSLKDSIELKKVYKIQQEISLINKHKQEIKNKIFTVKQIEELIIKSAYILFCILFILRYLFYGIKWSFKTLKK